MCPVLLQARRFPEGSEAKLFYEVGLQQLLICFTVVILISGKPAVAACRLDAGGGGTGADCLPWWRGFCLALCRVILAIERKSAHRVGAALCTVGRCLL